MATIFDYLDWRGDISLEADSFNEVDNLVLSWVVYAPLEEIIPVGIVNEEFTFEQIGKKFFRKYTLEEKLNATSMTRTSALLLQKIISSPRFSNMKVFNYVNHISEEEQKQFCAMTVRLDKDTLFVAYRGTDDTIVGWREDFNMSFMPKVPAQEEALEYLNKTLEGSKEKIYIGGHSKGGNLSVYSAIHADDSIKERIIKIYNNDGPGFMKSTIESDEYKQMLPKIKTILPESSVVGMLFQHEGNFGVVMSNQKGLMQHDAGSWEVLRNEFIYLDSVSGASKLIDNSIKEWVENQNESQRRAFVDGLFKLLESAGAKTTGELYSLGIKNVTSAAKTLSGMDPELKQNLIIVSKSLIKIISHNMTQSLKKSVKHETNQLFVKNE